MKIKSLIPWIFLCSIFLIGAATKQLIGPSSPTTSHAIARWTDNSAWKLTNSVVTIDNSGNMSGIATQTMGEADITTAYVTNFTFLQKSNAPTASDIGGGISVGYTNYMDRNVNGIRLTFWTDGTTVYSKQLAP